RREGGGQVVDLKGRRSGRARTASAFQRPKTSKAGRGVEKPEDGPISTCLSLSSDATTEGRFGRVAQGVEHLRRRPPAAGSGHPPSTKRNASRQSMNRRHGTARARGNHLKRFHVLVYREEAYSQELRQARERAPGALPP